MSAVIDLVEMIEECQRELRMRHQVYPRRVQSRTMNPKQAARQIDRLEAIIAVLQRLMEDRTALPDVVRDRSPPLFAA